jgi:hypothetical protein
MCKYSAVKASITTSLGSATALSNPGVFVFMHIAEHVSPPRGLQKPPFLVIKVQSISNFSLADNPQICNPRRPLLSTIQEKTLLVLIGEVFLSDFILVRNLILDKSSSLKSTHSLASSVRSWFNTQWNTVWQTEFSYIGALCPCSLHCWKNLCHQISQPDWPRTLSIVWTWKGTSYDQMISSLREFGNRPRQAHVQLSVLPA